MAEELTRTFIKGDWSPWQAIHTLDHEQQFAVEGGFIKVICITCGVYQPLAEMEAGIAPVRKAEQS